MANELHITYQGDANLYVVLRRVEDGKVWSTSQKTWVTWEDSSLSDYAITLTNYGGDFYAADFPQEVASSTQVIAIFYVQPEAQPTSDDLCLSRRLVSWGGTSLSELGTGDAFLRNYVRSKLGYPVIDVELTDEQIDFCVGDALRNFNQVFCHYSPRIVQNQYQNAQIELSDGAIGVHEVHALIPMDRRIYFGMNMFHLMYHMIFPRIGLADWYLSRTWLRQLQKSYGTDPTWRVITDPQTGKRTLWVDCFSGPYDIFFMEMFKLTVDTLQRTHEQYFQHFLDLVIAKAQIILGRIRGKFGGIPAPSGTLSTDATDLVSQGQAREKEILDWLSRYARFSAMPVAIG